MNTSITSSATIIAISPQIAKSMLDQDATIRAKDKSSNRPLRKLHVEKLTNDMLAGNWILTGNAIQFDEKGCLLDGQHRLHAVIKSGVTIQAYIITGLPPESFDAVDTGMRRSISQILRMEKILYAGFVGGVAMKILNWQKCQEFIGNAAQISIRESHKFVRANHESLLQSVRLIHATNKTPMGFPRTLAMAVHFVAKHRNQAEADYFFERLATGEQCDESPRDHMIFRLRELIIRNSMLKERKLSERRLAQILIRVWNNWRANKIIRFSGAATPQTKIE